MSTIKTIALSLVPLLGATVLTGCGEEPMTRDVYNSREECMQDWNDGELCTQMPDDDDYRRSHGVHHPIFWGPTYYHGDRKVSYKGQTVSPVRQSSSRPAYSITSRSPSYSRSGVSSPARSVSSGGFGGRSGGGGFGS
jgi:uncharacterized protein YgiB involved in biofilm formation